MSIGSFILCQNEAMWMGPYLASWLPHLDAMCLFDGFSTDGTLEIIKQFQRHHPDGHKIILVEGKDPGHVSDEATRENYVAMFNECMWTLPTDLALFAHPDMIPLNAEVLRSMPQDGVAYSVHMDSFAGEPDGQLYEIHGRGEAWKCIYRLRSPNLGAYYWGLYGHQAEDVYFREITGDAHDHHGSDFHRYPYAVVDSGLRVCHYSDVRPLARRVDRMRKVLQNNGFGADAIERMASEHPRVTLKDGNGFKFTPATYPPIFNTWKETLSVHA